ncbi:GNAT family N-acetyltransferase [Shewanella sp. Isolate11]|uniref:GNAT family N-acetyltransferase n=1 Tax=Shewanella sp. Isolate11 TaxID=2908530 RepID=UPI001EFC60AF|nr:GNAT family N-acetyltransferase [Shewanella sp. Isolate11]MCG9696658.1 GNAT family N-acetyltransferase [Shewanella sp. Isolate11]
MPIQIAPLTEAYFNQVIHLGNLVHGEGYLDNAMMSEIAAKGYKADVNANFIALLDNQVIGFRLTYAPQSWQVDKWCSPELWPVDAGKLCYFKCNTVAEQHRGKGIGKALLQASINATRLQGAVGGISHLWKQSPDNAAVGYFSKAGGKLIKAHAHRWNNNPDHPDYICVLCGKDCQCTAWEMLLLF